jgi:hypothetical protein
MAIEILELEIGRRITNPQFGRLRRGCLRDG